jgi:ADP-ribose pyrophosphatase YjhB (NUDIX family)
MTFCLQCGHSTVLQIPEGDNRQRLCCPQCGYIHYENPKMVVGTIPVWENKILLCKRAIDPRKGFWTLPAGFMELNESTQAGAIRETHEEAGAQFEIGDIYSILDVVKANQVHFFYLARLTSSTFNPGEETLEAKLFEPNQIPWAEIAFQTVEMTLRWFLSETNQQKNFHHAIISQNHN